MRTITLYQVDAFADEVFKGNPASVCVLDEWLDDALMQDIAMENNQAETVFVVKTDNNYEIRWFSPTVEIALCGHATVATAFILFNVLKKEKDQIVFKSKSGLLYVKLEADGMITIDFPADPPNEVNEIPAGLFEGLNIKPTAVWKGKFDYMVEVENEEIVNNLQPNFNLLATIQSRGVLVTAKGKEIDFVSRCFFPQTGVDEDVVRSQCMRPLGRGAGLFKLPHTEKDLRERVPGLEAAGSPLGRLPQLGYGALVVPE